MPPPTSLFIPSLPLIPAHDAAAARKHAQPTRRTLTLRHAPRRLPRVKASLTTSARSSELPAKAAAQEAAEAPPSADAALYDVVVIGAGPAGLSLASALGARGANVACLDAAVHRPWPNHYGVWRDEFARVGLQDCASAAYTTTAVYSGARKTVLDRAYIRVDRVMLKERLMARCVHAGVRLEQAFVRDVRHVSPQCSVVTFGPARQKGEGEEAGEGEGEGAREYTVCMGEEEVRARLVVDCTGHALQFTDTKSSKNFKQPWAQAAYGIEAEVESYPYQTDQMLLMDFRDKHMRGEKRLAEVSEKQPTFLYVFPTDEKRAFFEETSVLAPTAVSFEDLKDRLYRRLEEDGVVVKRVIEEEFSLIPMGGSLPVTSQRVVGFGGAACLVHPATGYMVARTVQMAEKVAGTIVDGLERIGEDGAVAEVSREVWDCTWSLSLRRQRDFLKFGAELLGLLTMDESRRFFEAFFALPEDMWSKFLSFELETPGERMFFALYFFAIASNPIRISLLRGIVEIGKWNLIRSVLPLWVSRGDES